MKPADRDTPRDPGDFEEVRRAYGELGEVDPPGLVDQAVLNRARRALDEPRPWYWNLGWVHGLTTAGVAALAVTLILQLREAPPTAGDLLAPTRQETTGQRAQPQADRVEALQGELAETDPAPAQDSADERGSFGASRAADGDTARLDDRAPELEESAAAVAPAPPAPAEGADSPGGADAPGLERRERAVLAEPQSAEAARRKLQQSRAADQAAGAEAAVAGEPETLLERIRALRAAGEHDQARQLLDAFREAYPDYPLPPDLQP